MNLFFKHLCCTIKFTLNKHYQIEKVHLDDLDLYVVTSAVVATSVFLWSSELKLTKKLTRLVSTSNKRSSSGEMKKRPEEGDIYREIWIFDTHGSKNWAVIINSHTFGRRFSDLWQWMWGVENFCNQVLTLIAKVLHTSHPLSKITEPPAKGVRINYHSSILWSMGVKNSNFPIYITLFRSFLHLSWWRPLVWGWN